MIFLLSEMFQEVPLDSINSVLGWIIGILLTFSTAVLIYIKALNKERITALENEITDLKIKYQAELNYGREQDTANIKLISDVSNVMTNSVKILEQNQKNLSETKSVLFELKSLQQDCNDRVKEIQGHTLNCKNG